MTIAQADPMKPRKPLRLWPGVILVALQLLIRYGVPLVLPESGMFAFLGSLVCALLVFVWWLSLSRARWFERVGAIGLVVLGMIVTKSVVDKSIAGGGMGMLLYLLALPVLALALVVWAVVTRNLSDRTRRVSMVAVILLVFGAFTMMRTGGITADGASEFRWRWSPTPEDLLVAHAGQEKLAAETASASAESGVDWPGFRGPERDGVVHGVKIATDWSASPPSEIWRRPIGPGWSSFAVHGDRVYTQEQRGDDEVVACYKLSTGEPIWMHRDAARFWESNAGAGPRATPTLSNGRVYSSGATGILDALDAESGAVIWSRNAAADTKRKTPGWGFASSPLVVDDVVVAATAGTLAGFDIATGNPRWIGPSGGWGYSSPHLVTLGGVKQIILLNGTGAISLAPADGAKLWEYEWHSDGIVQPALTAEGDLLIGSGSGMGGSDIAVGIRRISVAHGNDGWTTQERWTTTGLKPYFNDFVVHKGHAYGFDGSMISCIDLTDGARKWKGGRYGHGQLILLADQDLLLVLSEQGGLALVAANPDQYTELARYTAIEGKTWNHPVLAGDVLLTRNDREMAAFKLATAKR